MYVNQLLVFLSIIITVIISLSLWIYICLIMICAQGKAEMVERFRNSHFMCRNTEYLPVVFRPARDGANPAASSVTVVGRCMPPQVNRWGRNEISSPQ